MNGIMASTLSSISNAPNNIMPVTSNKMFWDFWLSGKFSWGHFLLLSSHSKRQKSNKQLVFNYSVWLDYKTSTSYFDLCVSHAMGILKSKRVCQTQPGSVYTYLLNMWGCWWQCTKVIIPVLLSIYFLQVRGHWAQTVSQVQGVGFHSTSKNSEIVHRWGFKGQLKMLMKIIVFQTSYIYITHMYIYLRPHGSKSYCWLTGHSRVHVFLYSVENVISTWFLYGMQR